MKLLKHEIDIPFLLFLIICFIVIGILKDVNTVLFLLVFFTVIVSQSYFLGNFYTWIKSKHKNSNIQPLIISTIFMIITTCFLYFFYGLNALLRAGVISLVVFIVIVGYIKLKRK